MICDRCGKKAEFTVLNYKRTEKSEIHLCRDCMISESEGSLPIPLKYFVGWIIKNVPQERLDLIFTQHCLSCGMNFRAFMAGGFIGCEECYGFFKPVVRHLAKIMTANINIQAKKRNTWEESRKKEAFRILHEKPVALAPDLKVYALKERLEALIQDERYEEAKKLADQIRAMKH